MNMSHELQEFVDFRPTDSRELILKQILVFEEENVYILSKHKH